MPWHIRSSRPFLAPTSILSLFSDFWVFLTASGLRRSIVLNSCPNSAEARPAAGVIAHGLIRTTNKAHDAERDSAA